MGLPWELPPSSRSSPTLHTFGRELSGLPPGITNLYLPFSHLLFPLGFPFKKHHPILCKQYEKNTIPLSNLDGIGVKDGGKITFNGMKEQSANLKDKLSQIANKQNIENTGSLLSSDIISDHLALTESYLPAIMFSQGVYGCDSYT